MKRPKKTLPLEKEILAPGIELINVGKGFTRQNRISVQMGVASADNAKLVFRNLITGAGKSFEQTIAIYEGEAIKTLEVARLPTNFGGSLTPPKEWDISPTNTLDGRIKKVYFALCREYPELGGMGLREFVASRGYRQREDLEWYAAAIVETISIIRAATRRKDTDFALSNTLDLGILVTEARARGFFKQTGAEGPPKRKRQKSPYPILASHLLRNYPDETDESRFDMVPSESELEIGKYKYYRYDKKIHAVKIIIRRDGAHVKSVGKPLGITGFRRHMTEARKRISR